MRNIKSSTNENIKRVVVIGDIILDVYKIGISNRISPEAPVPIVLNPKMHFRLGGAANVANNLKQLEADVHLIGVVGDDNEGRTLTKLLETSLISSDILVDRAKVTTVKERLISGSQHVSRIDYECGAVSDELRNKLIRLCESIFDKNTIVLLSDYAKGVLIDCKKIISIANAAGSIVLVDPKGEDFSKYSGAHFITPNFSEFQNVFGKMDAPDNLLEASRVLIQEYNISNLVLTRSADGVQLYTSAGLEVSLPATSYEVTDVTGAGDTLVATLAFCLSIGHSVRHAVDIANRAAGISVTRFGAVAISANELEKIINQLTVPTMDLVCKDADEIARWLSDIRRNKKRVVFTNGCFDILHPGHLEYLAKSRSSGDALVVGLNSDESVRALKGPRRPVNDFQHRKRMLEVLPFVDLVIGFNEPTPENLIRFISPDILTKGSDYVKSEVSGASFVESYGGQVVIVDLAPGFSTSEIIKRIGV